MAFYSAQVETKQDVERVFDYLSVEEWDPGVESAEKLTPGAVRVGTRVTLRAENSTIVSLDELTFAPTGRGTRLRYDANLTLKGPLKLFDLLLRVAFKRVGDAAADGLRATFARQARERTAA